jgi:hypothetical protein
LTQKEILEICKQKGIDISPMTLYRAGKKYGFFEVADEQGKGRKGKYKLNESKFNEWLSKNEIDDSYIAISEAKNKYGIQYTVFKSKLERNGCEIRKMGLIKEGLLYAKKSDIERIVAEYHKRS